MKKLFSPAAFCLIPLMAISVGTLHGRGRQEQAEVVQEMAGNGAGIPGYPVTIEDDLGKRGGGENRRIFLSKPVERVIVGEKGCALALLEFGVADRVIGAGTWIIDEIPGYENTLPVGDTYIDVELIIGLHPDLFITLANVATQSMDQLIQAGIQVYTVGTVQDLDHIKELITEFGLMFGKQAAAQKIVDELVAQEEQAARMVAARNAAEDQRPRVFMFGPMGDMQSLQTWAPSGETIVEDLIRKAGGRSITAEQGLTGWPQYSLEKLLESDPDIIILPISEAEFSSVEQFTSMDLVQHLKAVRNNRVYGIESSLIWDMSYKNGRALVTIAEFINRY